MFRACMIGGTIALALVSTIPAQAQGGRDPARLNACREEAGRVYQGTKTNNVEIGRLRRQYVVECMERGMTPDRRAKSQACRAKMMQAVPDNSALSLQETQQRRRAAWRRCMGS